MLAIDSETTGKDFHHGAKPFFVTICAEGKYPIYWEWDVDPLTREPQVPSEDIDEIIEYINPYNNEDAADGLVLQNAKFDVQALATIHKEFGEDWPWEMTYDTLYAGHVLASNRPHDLTSMAMQYLRKEIGGYEDHLKQCCTEARRMVQQARARCKKGKGTDEDEELAQWMIAQKGLACMPSTKDEPWKNDTWLPRAIAKRFDYEPDHPWWHVLADYSNSDSSVTVHLHRVMVNLLEERGYYPHYKFRLQLLPILYEMEAYGVTCVKENMEEKYKEFTEESERLKAVCENIAKGMGFDDFVLPKGGRSNQLMSFCFDKEYLSLEPYKRSEKTQEPSLDKDSLEHYAETLPHRSKAATFIRSLITKRARDTAISYMEGYERFWYQVEPGYWVLHPSLNATGTATLRLSSSSPNEQNISKKRETSLRYGFGPRKGRVWYALDYENIELRIPVYESKEPEMMSLFERPDEPPYFGSNHLLVAHILHREKFEACRDKKGQLDGRIFKERYPDTLYQWVKNGNFAIQYGAMEGTADRAYHVQGAYRLIKQRFKRMAWLNKHYISQAENTGLVHTLPDKRVDTEKGYPLQCTRSERGRIVPTIPLNYHVQGCLQGDSRVLTREGLVPIKELVGKKCTVWTGFRWAGAVGLDRGRCRTARITLDSGLEIDCDTRHYLKNERDEWVDFQSLSVGDYVSLPRNPDPIPFSEEINWWLVLGYMMGDGALSDSRSRKIFSLHGGELKKPLLLKIKKFLEDNAPVGDAYGREGYGGVRWTVKPATKDRQPRYAVSIESKTFSEFLESFGVLFSWKFDTKRVPKSVWVENPQNRRDFLQGVWLSDGARSSTRGAGFRLNMENPELLKEIQLLCSDLGFDTTLTGNSLKFRWRAFGAKSSRRYPPESLLKKAVEPPREMYEDSCQYITDKRNWKLAKDGKAVTQYIAERILDKLCVSEVYRYDKVVSITVNDNVETTYTMSVDDPLHQYVADGVVHKNTAMKCTENSMVRAYPVLNRWSDEEGVPYYMTMQVHDELVLDFPDREDNLARVYHIRDLMEQSGEDIGIPLKVSVSYHPNNWEEKVKI